MRPRDQEGDPDLGAGGGQCAGAGPREDVPEDEASDGGGTEAGQAQCGHVAGQVLSLSRLGRGSWLHFPLLQDQLLCEVRGHGSGAESIEWSCTSSLQQT